MLVEPNSDVLVDHMRNNKKLAMVFLFALGQWAMPFIPPQANSEKHVTKLMAVIPSFVAERAVAETPDSTQAPFAPSFPGLTAGRSCRLQCRGHHLRQNHHEPHQRVLRPGQEHRAEGIVTVVQAGYHRCRCVTQCSRNRRPVLGATAERLEP